MGAGDTRNLGFRGVSTCPGRVKFVFFLNNSSFFPGLVDFIRITKIKQH